MQSRDQNNRERAATRHTTQRHRRSEKTRAGHTRSDRTKARKTSETRARSRRERVGAPARDPKQLRRAEWIESETAARSGSCRPRDLAVAGVVLAMGVITGVLVMGNRHTATPPPAAVSQAPKAEAPRQSSAPGSFASRQPHTRAVRGSAQASSSQANANGNQPATKPTVSPADDIAAAPQAAEPAPLAGGSVSGLVQTSHGRPVANALVGVLENGEATHAVQTGTDGRFLIQALPEGPITLVAAAGTHLTPASADVAISAHQPTVGVELTLRGAVRLDGRVVDGEGQPIADARVLVEMPGLPVALEDTASESGHFSFDGVAADVVEVIAAKHGYRSAMVQVDATAGDVTVVLQREAVSVIGVIRAGSGADIPDEATVNLYSYDDGQNAVLDDQRQATITDKRFELLGVRPGRYTLELVADGSAPSRSAAFEVSNDGEAPVVEIDLEPGVELAGTVVDPSGQPVTGASVHLEGHLDHATTITDASGQFRFENLAPGSDAIVAAHDAYPPIRQAVTLSAAGSQQVQVMLESSTPVRAVGRVEAALGRAPVAGMPIRLRRTVTGAGASRTAESWRATTDADGAFEVVGLLPGRYVLDVAIPGVSSQPVTLSISESTGQSGQVLEIPVLIVQSPAATSEAELAELTSR